MPGELLGSATLELDTDLAPLDRGLADAKVKTAKALAEMQAVADRDMGQFGARMGVIGGTFDQALTPPLARFGAATDKMSKQVSGSLGQMTTAQGVLQRELVKTATVAEAAANREVDASHRVARAYLEQ